MGQHISYVLVVLNVIWIAGIIYRRRNRRR
jgi:hypothetical protein